MAQVGRISGPLLTANLERQGKDLDFRNQQASTPLLKLKVGTDKIGVNTTSPAFDLDINSTLAGTFLATSSLSPGNFTISNNDINALTGSISILGNTTVSSLTTLDNMSVLGTTTAKKIESQLTQSITLFESGSTQFGDTSDDTHQFSGSFMSSGSFSVNHSVNGISNDTNFVASIFLISS